MSLDRLSDPSWRLFEAGLWVVLSSNREVRGPSFERPWLGARVDQSAILDSGWPLARAKEF